MSAERDEAAAGAELRRVLDGGLLPGGAAWPGMEALPGTPRRAAVLVPIVPGPAPFVLLTRRAAALRHHPGQVGFPGGRPEPEDGTPERTALREAREEIGLDPATVRLLGRLPDQPTRGSGFSIVPVVGILSPEARWSPSASEVAAIFPLLLSVLTDPAAPRRIAEGLRRGSWLWPHPEHEIWGATAAILMRLSLVLRGEPAAP
ncbi:CoA pyrophosphatase [Rhizosaccharibacter radicis]|uniref:CoA pyrophosphatase n=1 Tax=Rhizosaccharibacter radicis TaxID=2782605 RepID=A0ABT1W2T7_9PROT|nr:CoA pyrophosphatase [Acetobacteraceae bacterium KSS12]